MSNDFTLPDGVRPISFDDTGKLGVHEESKRLYWGADELSIKKKVSLRGYELLLASITALSALLLVMLEIYRTFYIV